LNIKIARKGSLFITSDKLISSCAFSFNFTLFFILKLLSLIKATNKFLASFFIFTFGFSWLHIWTFALSESVFLPLLLAWIYYLIKPGKYNLVYAAGAFIFLSLTRYLAWMLIPGLILPIILINGFWRKALFSIIPAVSVSFIWLFFNLQHNSKPFGGHDVLNKFSLIAMLENLASWFDNLINGAFTLNVAFLIIVVIMIALSILLILFRDKVELKRLSVLSLVLGIGVSLIILLLVQPGLSLIQLPRYISIFWVPTAISVYLWLEQLSLKDNYRKILLLVSIAFHLVLLLVLGLKQREKANSYLMLRFAFMHYVKDPNYKLYDNNISNFPDLVWWVTKNQCSYTPFINEDRKTFLFRLGSNRNHFLIWFEDETRNQVMRPDLDWVVNKKPCYIGQGFRIMELDSFSYCP
jgi:hypothetical protein